MHIAPNILEYYKANQARIMSRLVDFKNVSPQDYFYEFCYCICTPQSRATNAMKVQNELMRVDFLHKPIDPVPILRNPENYIRFHNTKAQRLLEAREYFPEILNILKKSETPFKSRNEIKKIAKGFGMKESSHFLRNIGYNGLAILDRHILKHLVQCGLYNEIPKVNPDAKYIEVEQKMMNYADSIGIPLDELDIVFWSYESGEILK